MTFTGALAILVAIFATSDLFMRGSTVISIAILPSFLCTMLPVLAVLAFPLAAGLAIALPIGSLLINDELLFIQYAQRARADLHKAVLLLSGLLTIIYGGLVFLWAPQSHLQGKQMLLSFASTQFAQLEPGIFHTPFPGLTLYFKHKAIIGEAKDVEYKPILLAYFKEKQRYFFTANQGIVHDGIIYLRGGQIYSIGHRQNHVVQFKETEINIRHFFDSGKTSQQSYRLKFMTLGQLWHHKAFQNEAVVEFHKRIVQIIWQFLFPFFALFGVIVFGNRKSNLLLSLIFVGGLYIFAYASNAAGQSFATCPCIMLPFLYLCPVFVFILLLYLYQR